MSELVPRLRFGEFDYRPFAKTRLGETANYFKGLAFKSDDYQTDGCKNNRIIRVSDLSSDSIKENNTMIYYPDSQSKNVEKYRIKAKDIIVTTVGSRPELKESAVGRGIFIDTDNNGFLNQNLLILRTTHDNVSKFIASQINTNRYIDYIKSIQRGNANQANITVNDLLDYPVVVTSTEEQQKIADFLTSVDSKISQLTEKHRLLTQYKKGVMQQIFNQQLRFKDEDGNEFGEWEVKPLGSFISKVGSGSTPKGGRDAYTETGVIFIRSQNIYNNKLDLTDTVFISEAIHQKMKGSQVRALDILLNITGASIGRSCVTPVGFTEGNVNQHVCIIRPMKLMNPYFLQKYLSSDFGQKLIFQTQAGGGREGLNFQAIRSFKIPTPHLKEQQKIAQFLQAIDAKIDATNQQLEQTKLFKKGLLQQMFV